MRACTPALLLCLFSASALHAQPLPGIGIKPDALAEHIRVLASDAFEGRAPATPGEDRTVAYLAEQFERAGLEPGGEDGGWTQRVTLVRSEIKGPVHAQFELGETTQPLVNSEDIAVESLHPAERVDLQRVPLVFAGYGVHAPELDWDDFGDLDVRGKLLVVLVNDPDFESGEGRFGGRAMTYYGRWTYKYEEAARRGAAGVLIVHEDAPAAYPWATVRNGRNGPQLDIVRDDADTHHLKMRGWMQRAAAERLFTAAGLDFEAAKRAAQQPGFKAHALEGASLSIAFDVQHSRIVSRNVLGLLPGEGRADETVVVSGHWDHFGITPNADASGDNIINGAVDNATALASMIELARVFAAGERPQRSLLFFAPTAEENGLLGAKYYVANPLRPLATTAAVINIEMWSPDGPTRDISSWGLGKVSLERSLEAAAAIDGRTRSLDENLEAGLFYRADHFAFAQAGVPALTLGPGTDLLDGGIEAGKAARAKYFAERYHQPADEYDDSWDMRGPTRDTQTVYRLVESIARSADWPQWDADSEFAAERTKTDALRASR
ncbi:M28 family peptidase [Aquimonas voraii]|uniref:Zn-dependent amino-or carboxypeptidase, M28 family n=1 Tax=Aquimonas voraii TaxID=265719 RepID=A0A1G6UV35_9GAMM|nr:M28 family peptidase [Aquimonas voraii]SDD44576.1 Zn-dependent amino-or carboxypeptidase, M28 family [Aquimonas voraii]